MYVPPVLNIYTQEPRWKQISTHRVTRSFSLHYIPLHHSYQNENGTDWDKMES